MSTLKRDLTIDLTEQYAGRDRFLLALIALLGATLVTLALPFAWGALAAFVRVAIVGIGGVVALRIVNPDGRSFRLSR